MNDDLGPDRWELDYSPENAWKRLKAILDDKVLRFNPYLVDDETLLDCAMRGHWRDIPALTQMVVFNFLEIRKVITPTHEFEAIFYRVGYSDEEHYFPVTTFLMGPSYRPTRQPQRQLVGKQRLTNFALLEKLQGNSYFVSHALKGHLILHSIGLAYRMTRLWGTNAHKARLIREAMVSSKIIMMEEVLKYPYNLDYLACPRNLIDYTPVVQQAIEMFRHYPEAQPI